MTFISTRRGFRATSAESVARGLAPDGGLYVPSPEELRRSREGDAPMYWAELGDLGTAAESVMARMFSDLPVGVRRDAVANLLSKFPAADPIPLVDADSFKVLELFHGPTGAFKDVALSVLPVLMAHATGDRRVLILTATSGDTGSAAMQGFAGVPGTEVAVFYPDVGTSRIQRLQMTTPTAPNVHAIAIRGNFDDAQAAVKRIFADPRIREEAAAHGVELSSANSINTGRLVPQIAYYLLAAAKLGAAARSGFDVVVPSGNFGNILAAYYAKLLGAPIRKLVVASNVNDVLARFVATGVYDPGDRFTVTNSPSMDIRKSSNVERLLWMISGGLEGDVAGACAETARMMRDLETKGRYELSEKAKARLMSDFVGGVATPEETEAEMRRMREACGYLLDPHTAVATAVAKKLMDGKFCASLTSGRDSASPLLGDVPVVVAATATPYKFPETCKRAFGADVLADPPPSFRDLETLPIAQKKIVEINEIDQAVKDLF